MSYINDLQPLTFGGIMIPYVRIRFRGVQRAHVHEFPHVNGGAVEKQGRKLYESTVSAKFDEKIGRSGGKYQNRILMNDLAQLQEWFEAGETKPLYLPNIGEIKAYAMNWERELSVQLQSGENVEIAFGEDMEDEFLPFSAIHFSSGIMATSLQQFDALKPDPDPSVFQQIREGVNAVLAIRDQGLMWVGFVGEKIEGLRRLFQEADQTLDILNDPTNYLLLEEFKHLWEAVNDFGENVFGMGEFVTYTTPSEMTIDEASEAIYGDSEHQTDLANWNAITDLYHIPAGMKLNYIVGV